MMMQENQPLCVSGCKVTAEVQMDSNLTNAIQYLRQELATKQAENLKLTDQLNCLISLIKRSWTGDRHATLHLSNIVVMDPPQHLTLNDGRAARPNSQLYPPLLTQTRCEKNWALLTAKLLNREYLSVQQQIREYQQQYIENRQEYMDAVLQDHQQIMSRIPLHHKSDPFVGMDEMDSKFIRRNKALQRMGAEGGSNFRLVQSAGHHRKLPVNDAVEKMEVSLRDLVGDIPSSDPLFSDQALNSLNERQTRTLRRPKSSVLSRHLPPNTYNDPGRYTQGNLFALNESDCVKKPRPVSATILRAGDIIRSRPRTGRVVNNRNSGEQTVNPVFVTQRSERPLKYETTHPLSSKPKSAKHRGRSADGINKRTASASKAYPIPLTDVISTSSKTVLYTAVTDSTGGDPNCIKNKNEHFSGDGDSKDAAFHHDTPSVRVKSAIKRQPIFIDEFAKDEQAMRDIQEDFRKTALSLQKKLGISDSGIVTYD